MLGSLELLAEQVRQVLRQANAVKIPKQYAASKNMVVAGMGGSTLGAHLLKSVFNAELRLPFEIINHYRLPGFVDKNTLVIVSSYSGGTEEPLAALREAKKRGAKLVIITSGGKLAETAKSFKIPALIFTTENNPCGSPRMGLGYSIAGQLLLFSKVGLIKFSQKNFLDVIKTIEHYNALFGIDQPERNNAAKKLAGQLQNRTAWYIGADHLVGSAHIAANQLNENAKYFGGYFSIPELNHHLMEGLAGPKTNQANTAFVLIESSLYDQRVQKRFAVTKEILQKNKISAIEYVCQEKTPLLQAMECLVLSSYTSYYLALKEGIDPTAIPLVDYFKAALQK